MIVHKLDFLRFLKWDTKLLIAIFVFTVISCAQNTNLESDLVPEPHNSKTAPRQMLESELEYKIQAFRISSNLCSNDQGPNCKKLRLGDDYLTTSLPAQGYLFSCTNKNPNAPGAVDSKITWIDNIEKTWNFFLKLWLPSGEFEPGPGVYLETNSTDERQIKINNLPVDERIGDWPMTEYQILTDIDPNPGVPIANTTNFSYPVNPKENRVPTCVSLGTIGVTTNGIVIFNAADARGEDAVAREIVDIFGGHPAMEDYHYHFIPERLDTEILEDGHSGIVGYINDGFPIYGYRGEGGIEMSNDDLDICHGHDHGALRYHYHATIEYPYTIGCYTGTPISTPSNIGPTANRPRRTPK